MIGARIYALCILHAAKSPFFDRPGVQESLTVGRMGRHSVQSTFSNHQKFSELLLLLRSVASPIFKSQRHVSHYVRSIGPGVLNLALGPGPGREYTLPCGCGYLAVDAMTLDCGSACCQRCIRNEVTPIIVYSSDSIHSNR